ncbi:MAG: hypothetical protein V9E93_16830 [Steroidobacteraceae bacterium]|nr:hypothetical protein [Steroidobacteraceae bacterium]MBP7013308.1 hypothetical protein [Steroidobacteraceae bacterium]
MTLPEPRSATRPAMVGRPDGLARVRAGTERLYWQWQEYRESAATHEASALLVTGSERHSGAPLRSLYFGSGNHLSYVLGLLYDEYRIEEEHRHLHAWQARNWVEGYRNKVDFVVADLPWPYHRLLADRGLLQSPAWVDQKLSLPESWGGVLAQLRSSARGEDLRKIRKHGLRYRIVRDEEAIRRFYGEMYVPHLTNRFGSSAYIEPEWKVRYCAENGALMEILREGEVVAGQVLFGDRQSLQLLWAGTSGGEFGQQSQGVFPALYYFGLLYAFERGYHEADYCGSRPLLSDGIFQLKRRWGGQVYDGWSRDTLFFLPIHLGQANLGFLTRHPLIARCGQDLVGKVMLGTEPIQPDDVARAELVYATAGLQAIRLYSLQRPGADALDAARATTGIELVDLSREAQPAATYCRR